MIATSMAQDNRISDINDLVIFLAAMSMKPILDDDIWLCYGYKRRPKKGSIWNKLFPNMFKLENLISREVLTMAVIDVLNGIKMIEESHDTKLLLFVGVVDQLLEATKHLFRADEFIENLISTYDSYLQCDKAKLYEPIILKSKKFLDKRDFAQFKVGTIRLLSFTPTGNYLLKSDYIKKVVAGSGKENKLRISMSDETYWKYVPMMERRMVNSA